MKTMKICDRHEKQVPILWTFAFNGSEYWCPHCGANWGMLGAGKNVPVTFALKREKVRLTKETEEYLDARSATVCVSMEWEGKEITYDQLPEQEKDRIQKILKEWEYEYDKELT